MNCFECTTIRRRSLKSDYAYVMFFLIVVKFSVYCLFFASTYIYFGNKFFIYILYTFIFVICIYPCAKINYMMIIFKTVVKRPP